MKTKVYFTLIFPQMKSQQHNSDERQRLLTNKNIFTVTVQFLLSPHLLFTFSQLMSLPAVFINLALKLQNQQNGAVAKSAIEKLINGVDGSSNPCAFIVLFLHIFTISTTCFTSYNERQLRYSTDLKIRTITVQFCY